MESSSAINWTTVLISVGGAVGSSGLISWFLMGKRIKKQRDQEIKREREHWYHQVNSINLRIWRTCLELPYGVDLNEATKLPENGDEGAQEMKKIISLIDELLNTHTNAPPEIERDVLQDIEDIGYWFDNLDIEESDPTTTDIRDRLVSDTQNMMDQVSELSERYEEPPYY
ncbi:hypothetical protein HZS55_04190 [Halosimplex rubrum]|uniref:Uncharacterized protein n=1 Tax=Halosimplex rubrum TaxID=869889 RepID=A0A7D5SWF1_9EURY|nr:hypothetical protein [Halosimplex rubrum]QLH76551.1 hypothetical protein HZS55_04190 [Halosimplex rubrum]